MSITILDNATIWIGDGARFDGHVCLEGERIVGIGHGRYRGKGCRVDLDGLALSPGMIDSMVLGGFGFSVLRDGPLEIARRYLGLGVTACQFCYGARDWETMAVLNERVAAAKARADADAAQVIGVYCEGPFMNVATSGASRPAAVEPPTKANVDRLLALSGDAITMVNVSPGTEGDLEAVAQLVAAGKIVTMAHSDAPAERVLACIEAGTSVCGHCWNNHNGALAEPGVQRATLEHVALTDERVRAVHVICDGKHVHPILVRMMHRCRGVAGVCLVTDAVKQAGGPDGPFEHDDGTPMVKRNGVGRTQAGTLAGSALLLADHLRHYIRFTGAPPHEAIRTVTYNPALTLGLEAHTGRIAIGAMADLVAWDDAMRVRRVWRAGREVEGVADPGEVMI